MERTWTAIEEHFPPAGVRARMSALLGEASLASLERAGVVVLGAVATRYPCPAPCPEGCPLEVLENEDGTFTAFCPTETEELTLSEDDVRLRCLDLARFVEMLRRTLNITGRHEWLPGLPNVCRLGAHVPAPGVRFPIFFVARCSPADYAATFDVLLAQGGGKPFAAVVLTRRHISHEAERRLAEAGVVVVVLAEVLRIGHDGLRSVVEPCELFGRLGQAPAGKGSEVVARAIIGRNGRFSWSDLDQDTYEGLVAQRERYDIFADELTRTCSKRGKRTEKINPAHFATIRAAMERRSKYDPDRDAPGDRACARQTFQRARKTFDIGSRKTWKLFKTDESDEVTRYDFNPDPDVSFVFIFAPSK